MNKEAPATINADFSAATSALDQAIALIGTIPKQFIIEVPEMLKAHFGAPYVVMTLETHQLEETPQNRLPMRPNSILCSAELEARLKAIAKTGEPLPDGAWYASLPHYGFEVAIGTDNERAAAICLLSERGLIPKPA